MCGLIGILSLDGAPIAAPLLERGNNAQRHRGPDDEGYLLVDTTTNRAVACRGADTDARIRLPSLGDTAGHFTLGFGFRRLSIQDLSPAGHQPIASPDGRLWLVFNGEIYNFVELREELATFGHQFRGGSDSEVILAAYERWGDRCTERFNGMWAFAIWDSRERQLFLSRDRFGEKPLHYVHVPGKLFAFASEMKGLWASAAVERSPDEETVARFRYFGEVDGGEQTFFANILRLPQGHNLVVTSNGRLRKWRYWDLAVPPVPADPPSEAEAIDRFAQLFTDSVRLRLRADVPIGSSLSGGLDSSTVVCVIDRLLPPGARQKTFSARCEVEALDEGRWMDQVSAVTRVEAHHVTPRGEAFWDELPEVFWYHEEPFQSTSMYAQFCVMRLAAENGVTVLLDGQGADETLGGYHVYFDEIAYGLLKKGDVGGYHEWRQTCQQLHAKQVGPVAPFVRQTIPLRWRRRVKRALGLPNPMGTLEPLTPTYPVELKNVSALRKRLWWDATRVGLHELLRYADRNSMAHSREVRLPFLDHRLVEYVFTLPDAMLIRNGWTKWLLRQAFPAIVPEPIRNRLDKIAYNAPETEWIGSRPWKDVMLSTLLGGGRESAQALPPPPRYHSDESSYAKAR